MFTDQQAVQRLAQIPDQVKAVSDLDDLWRTLANAVGKRPTPIPTDYLQLGAAMRGQPRGECRRLPVRQQIDDAVLVEVDQERPIAQATPEGEVIHTEPTQIRRDLADGGRWRATDQTQQTIAARPTGSQLQPLRESSSSLATQCKTHRFKPAVQRRRTSLVAWRHVGQALTEGLTRTRRIQAAEPPRMQTHKYWQFAQGEIREHADEAAVRSM